MARPKDPLLDAIWRVIKHFHPEPLETTEVIRHLRASSDAEFSRSKVLYRLNELRATGLIGGKPVDSGNLPGVGWVWWTAGVVETRKSKTMFGQGLSAPPAQLARARPGP